MSEQVSPSLIKETQDALSKYVKKPPLSEKLLSKPPFRYLHDIVTVVIKETGFLDGVFTAEELDSNNVKDKESKISFLNKLISAVKSSTGKNVTVRAAKIVAGLEVNKTLELLQIIGKSIDEKVDATKNVAQLPEPQNADIQDKREDEKEKKIKEKVPDVETKESRKITDKVNTNQRKTKPNEKEDASSNRRNSIEKSSTLKKAPTSKNTSDSTGRATRLATNSEAKTTVPKPLVKRNSISTKSVPIRKPSLKNTKQSSISKALPAVIKEEKEENNDAVERKKEAPEKDNKAEKKNVPKNTESKPRKEQDNLVSDKVKETESVGNVGDIKQAQGVSKDEEKEKSPVKRRESVVPRPGSARPGSRKMVHDDEQSKTVPKETTEANGNDPKNRIPPSIRPRTANRPASARPGAPRIRDRGEVAAVEEPVLTAAPVNVIEEGKQDHFMDDRESFIVIEDEKAPLPSNDTTVINETEQGQLVHQILKTQKELNESVVADRGQNKQPQIEWEAGRQAEKEMVSEEIEKIRKSIQALTSAANPLGKLFDFLQEDVDEMQRELQHWKSVNEKLQKQQQSELELGKTLLQPLQKQLSDVENSIDEEYSQIANIKMTVLNNDEKILKLATSNGPKIRIK